MSPGNRFFDKVFDKMGKDMPDDLSEMVAEFAQELEREVDFATYQLPEQLSPARQQHKELCAGELYHVMNSWEEHRMVCIDCEFEAKSDGPHPTPVAGLGRFMRY